MLEIVHDVAPGAGPLFFASFGGSGAFMADGVRCLADAGAKVIVDDVTFGDEPFFQDGPLAIAAREAVQRGITYHTSAGNRRQEFLVHNASKFKGPAHKLGGLWIIPPAARTEPQLLPFRAERCSFRWGRSTSQPS